MLEISRPKSKEDYILALFNRDFTRIEYLALYETGLFFHDALDQKNSLLWWKGRTDSDAQISAEIVELWGRIDKKNGLLHLAAFTADRLKPLHSVHSGTFSVLWRDSYGLFID